MKKYVTDVNSRNSVRIQGIKQKKSINPNTWNIAYFLEKTTKNSQLPRVALWLDVSVSLAAPR